MPKTRYTIKYLQELPTEDLSKMTDEEMEPLLRAARKQVERRVQTIAKSGLYSHAVEGYLSNMYEVNEDGYKKLRNLQDPLVMSRQAKYGEIKRIQEFLNSKTSTVKGIKQVNKEQDLRLFGYAKSKLGRALKRPLKSLSENERRTYWKMYDEFNNRFKDMTNYKVTSTVIQTYIAEELFGSSVNFSSENIDINELLNSVHERIKESLGPTYEEGHKISGGKGYFTNRKK